MYGRAIPPNIRGKPSYCCTSCSLLRVEVQAEMLYWQKNKNSITYILNKKFLKDVHYE